MPLLDDLLSDCVRLDASDVHLVPGRAPFFRVHGVLEAQAERVPLTPADLDVIVETLTRNFDRDAMTRNGAIDGAITGPGGVRFRFNVFRSQGEMAAAIRRLEDRFRSLSDLGLPESLYSLCDLPDGLVLVCGPTGSGKSTTLATMLDRINRTRKCHVITIEDPVEYLHESQLSLVNQRQLGRDTPGFNEALVASLRQDPDVILVGEIRDLNTIRTAVTAAETGHLVFTTVHAGDCVGSLERVVSVFPADEQIGVRRQLSLVLRAVIAQHLLVADGPAAIRPSSPGQTVRRSRIVTSEVMTSTPAVANLIASAKTNQIYSAMETGTAQGMQTLEQDLARLVVIGMITEATATMMSRSPGVLKDRIAMLRKSPPKAGVAR